MKALVWITAAVLALFWSGMAFITIAMVDWLAGAMSGGQLSELAGVIAQWPVPAWLAFFLGLRTTGFAIVVLSFVLFREPGSPRDS